MRARIIVVSLSVVLLSGIASLFAFKEPPGASFSNSTTQVTPTANDEGGIHKALQSYVDAMNKGDLKSLMTNWSADPEFIDEAGNTTRGQEAIAALFKRTFDEQKGATFAIKVRQLRFIKPDVAVQDGRVTFTTTDGLNDEWLYTSIWVKVGGKWLISRVQDLPSETAAPASNAEHLKQLEWLLGDWVSEGDGANVSFTCRWNKSQSFLVMEQSIHLQDKDTLEIKHVIGWDPAKQQIRSWFFDSRGGFGESLWTRKGNRWTLEAQGVLSDGRRAEATSTWHYIDDRNCEWDSTSRELDGRPMPDIKIKYVSKVAKK